MKKNFIILVAYYFSTVFFASSQSAFINQKKIQYKTLLSYTFPIDSLSKKKNCWNSWCFGTSAIPLLSIVSYNSFLMNQKVKFVGLKLGAEIAEKVRCGIGFYDLNKGVSLKPVYRDKDTLLRTAHFNYWNLFAEYVFFEDFCWELSLPLGIGKAIGKIDTLSSIPSSNSGSENIASVGILNIGFDCQYKFISWLGIGTGIGYRHIFAPQYLQEKINAPSYNFKIKIFLGYLFKAIFMRKKLAEEKNAYLKECEERKSRRIEKKELKKKEKAGQENFENHKDY